MSAQPGEFRRIALEPERVAVTQAVTGQVMASAQWDQTHDRLRDTMIHRLQSHVLRHRVFDRDLVVETEAWEPRTRWQMWKARGAETPTIHSVSGLLRAVIAKLRPPKLQRLSYETRVRLEEWASFPENTMRYPDELGAARRVQVAVFPDRTVTADGRRD